MVVTIAPAMAAAIAPAMTAAIAPAMIVAIAPAMTAAIVAARVAMVSPSDSVEVILVTLLIRSPSTSSSSLLPGSGWLCRKEAYSRRLAHEEVGKGIRALVLCPFQNFDALRCFRRYAILHCNVIQRISG